ncbi:HAD hydrolase-like protein [Zoogloea sp. LCSB751]|uniref:HAD hydrolase-like protein n=1 Tax=Zoogloea sp. LCSB751 TaxID=1965277 RepID=UPI0009A4EDD7|nr:HAD hydrolase-like protein [Zoogloea sp. LCSB751]
MSQHLAVFDFDGTLADSFDAFLVSLNEVAKRHGFRGIAPDATEEPRKMSGRQLMDYLGIPFWKVPAIAVDMRQRVLAHIDMVRPYPGTAEALRAIAGQGTALALVTSNSREAVHAVLGAETLALFAQVHCGASLFGKRFKLQELLWSSRLKPQQVVYVGDEIRDAEAAAAVGMAFLGVAWGFTRAAEFQKYCRHPLVERMEDLPAAIAEVLPV